MLARNINLSCCGTSGVKRPLDEAIIGVFEVFLFIRAGCPVFRVFRQAANQLLCLLPFVRRLLLKVSLNQVDFEFAR